MAGRAKLPIPAQTPGKSPDIAAKMPQEAGQNASVLNHLYLLFTRKSEG